MILQIIAKGGPSMIALGICSFIGIWITVQKLIYLKLNSIQKKGFVDSIKAQLVTDGIEKTMIRLSVQDTAVSRVLQKAIFLSSKPEKDIEEGIKDASMIELPKLERHLTTLANIVTAGPMIGLLGTVLGIISIFNVISGGHINDLTALSQGIAEALISTVGGLCVAIPFIFIHQYLSHLVSSYIEYMEYVINEVVIFCKTAGSEIKA